MALCGLHLYIRGQIGANCMKQTRLRNLLQALQERLRRTERSIIAIEGEAGNAGQLVRLLRHLRLEVRRQETRLDSFNLVEVAHIERRVKELRELADTLIHTLGADTAVGNYLQSIHRDEVGLSNLAAGMKIGLGQMRPEDMLDMVPGQKPAAYHFNFNGDILTVADQPLTARSAERDIALSAIETAIEQGEYINGDLAGTNVSPRLKDAFVALQSALQAHKNIVQVGMRNQLCNRMLHAEAEELSPPLFSMLVGHVESVFSALSQFEEWRIFSENAVSTNLDKDSVAALTESTRSLVRHLREIHFADSSVPDALSTVASWVDEQDIPDRRDVLSLARTLENVWSAVTKPLLEVAKETAAATRKVAVNAIATAIVAAVTGGMLVALAQVPGAQWVETTYRYLTTVGSKAGTGGGSSP